MNKTLSASLIVIAILILAGSIFFLGIMYSRVGLYGSLLGLVPNGNARPCGWNSRTNSNITALTVDQARQAAEKYLQTLKIRGLEAGEVMIFDNNAYVVIKGSETGLGAFELLLDPVSGIAYPEYGPN